MRLRISTSAHIGVFQAPPDFAPDNFEVDFRGRATEADLTPLGRSQMGLPPLETPIQEEFVKANA